VYKPSDFLPDHQKQRGARLAAVSLVALVAVTAMVLQLPRGATAGAGAIGADDRVASQAAPAPRAASRKAPTAYQLRCWQNGFLLFDEGPVTLDGDPRQGAKMVAIDRHGRALIVTADLSGTTCLARPAPPPPSLALPR
jgi:hypothetical protein